MDSSGNKNDVTVGQIEVDLNKEFKGEDWSQADNGFGSGGAW